MNIGKRARKQINKTGLHFQDDRRDACSKIAYHARIQDLIAKAVLTPHPEWASDRFARPVRPDPLPDVVSFNDVTMPIKRPTFSKFAEAEIHERLGFLGFVA